MRIVPTTRLKRPRFLYNISDVNGDYIVDVNGKTLVFYKGDQNVVTNLKATGRPNDYTWDNIPEEMTWEDAQLYWDGLLQKTTFKRPRFLYTIIDVNGDNLVDVNNKTLKFYKGNQNINTIWR